MNKDNKVAELAALKLKLRDVHSAVIEAERRGNFDLLDKLYDERYNLSTEVAFLEHELAANNKD